MTLLRRRQWLALTGSALLTACSGSRSPLAVQQGLLPSPWLRRLPRDWRVEPLELREQWPPLGGQVRSAVLSDGWATASDAPPWQPLAAGPWQQDLLSQAAPLMPISKPKMRIGSSIAFTTAPASVTYIARPASPTPRSAPEAHIISVKTGTEGSNI